MEKAIGETQPASPPSRSQTSSQRSQPAITLDLVLHCGQSEVEEHRTIEFQPHPPRTLVRDVKLEIERVHSIPYCVQTLLYDSHTLGDDSTLDACYIRSGDNLHVRYPSEGDCEAILEITRWMGLLLAALKQENPSLERRPSVRLERLLTLGEENKFMNNLAFDHFYPSGDEKKYVNKLHFLYNGGLDILMKVYALLFRQPWSKCHIKLKYLEYDILCVLWNLAENFAIERLINQHGGLEMVMRSLFRKTLVKGEAIKDEDCPTPTGNWILVQIICYALGVLGNICEVPECHESIASRRKVLLQLSHIALSPVQLKSTHRLVACIFLTLAYTPATHPYLADPVILETVLEACQSRHRTDTLLVRYFTQMFLSELVLVSPHCIPPQFCSQIQAHMQDLLSQTDPDTIRLAEVKEGYYWLTLVPFVKLAYEPDSLQTPEMQQLQLLSLETVLLGLRNMLARETHRKVLLREGLLDFVLCLPSYVPESLRPHARQLIKVLSSNDDVCIGPPRLVNVVKAKLAKWALGLERVMEMSVGEIVSEFLPS